jgi:hypothetical protein
MWFHSCSMPASLPELVLRLPSIEALRAERPNLEKRRAFVAGATGVEMRQVCLLVIVHPASGARLALPAEVVWVAPDGPGKGVGVELRELDVEELRTFIEAPEDPGAGEPVPEDEDDPTLAPDEAEDPAEGRTPEALRRATSLHERVRAFSLRERETCARSGMLSERVALERAFGTAVWEGLLQNPQLTPPEVARIARNGTASGPVLAAIVANGSWLSVGEVQRALLANPRVTGPQIERVLRSLSQSDLRRATQQTSYRASVRQAAQKLLKG